MFTFSRYRHHKRLFLEKRLNIVSWRLLPSFLEKEVNVVYSPPNSIKIDDKTEQALPEERLKRCPDFRVNELNIQMLSKALYEQIFKNTHTAQHNSDFIDKCRRTLKEHNMTTKEEDYVEDVNFVLPPLKGASLEEHFQIIGEEQAKPYKDIVEKLLTCKIPIKPKQWLMQPGWTRYVENELPEQVPYPLEDGLIFDVEVCVKDGKIPTLATAVSNKAWYGWMSQSLVEGNLKPVTENHYTIDMLIPMESTSKEKGMNLKEHLRKPKIVVGHNVSYDRSRIKEQYWLSRTGMRFLDTMSLHICISGVTSFQRALLKSKKFEDEDEEWKAYTSLNSLSEVHKLYCGKTIDKKTRDIFVEGSLADIKNDFQNAISYCADDVVATYNILKNLYYIFLERFPHPVTFAGMLELNMAYLPVNSNWIRYLNDSEQAHEDLEIERRHLLARRAEQACHLLHDDKYKEDIWMWDLDWEVKTIKLRKAASKNTQKDKDNTVIKDANKKEEGEEEVDELYEKFKYLWDTRKYLPAIKTLLPGYPNWYRKLCTKVDSDPNWTPGPHLISTSMQITPKLLSLTWEGYPLHFIRGKGWGFLVPFSPDLNVPTKLPLKQILQKCPLLTGKPDFITDIDDSSLMNDVENNLSKKDYYSRVKKDKTDGAYKGTGIWCNTIIDDCCYFFKLPHKDGASHRVGNPLAKDFLNKFSENVLAGDTDSAEHILSITRQMSYWRNNRSRIMEQMVVWLNNKCLPIALRDKSKMYGAILPQVAVCGTLTRRAVESTWMTASNAHPERIGSELRAMIQAPPGYSIVGADVDSQELWIASILGDSHHAKMHGATPFGWMTISGNKANNTDMHSVTAKAVGISRDHAKVINYARIYGAGQNFAEQLLKQYNPSMSSAEARSKATKMFTLTKGKRIYRLKKEYLLEFEDKPYSLWHAMEIAKLHKKKVEEMFIRPKWIGGTESSMFNRLEEIANDESPTTPFLNCRLSRAIEPKNISDDRFLPTRINWVVQSGAVDFLHLMLVCMRWLLGDNVRFCLSFHDEVRYLVPEKLKYETAMALHITNLLTRSFCSIKLGINDLPMSVSFFSSVEVDTVLRKDCTQDCKTPSNPHGLLKGYGIPNGEAVDIYEAIKKVKAWDPKWYHINR